jgi:hypothetical protein
MGTDDPSGLFIRRWRPKQEHSSSKRQRRRASNAPSKRKSRATDPFSDLGAYRQISREKLDAILSKMGDEFDISAAKRTTLLNDINDLVLNVVDMVVRTQKMPPASEMKEQMKSVEVHAKKLLDVFEVERSPEDVSHQPVQSDEINPHVCSWLAEAVNPERPDRELVATAVSAVAVLVTLARRAQLSDKPKRDRKKPIQLLSRLLSNLYREAFDKEPTRYAEGEWVRFLDGVIRAGLNLNLCNGRLRQLPISPGGGSQRHWENSS